MSRINWYKRNPDKALAGMMGLSLEERGAYNTLLDLIYARAGNVPDDDKELRRILECDIRVWRRIRARLIDLGKIYVHKGIIRNSTADEVLEDALSTIDERLKAGVKSGESRRREKQVGQTSGELPANLFETSGELLEEVSSKSYPVSQENNDLARTKGGLRARAESQKLEDSLRESKDSLRSENATSAFSPLDKLRRGSNGSGHYAYPDKFELFYETAPKRETQTKSEAYKAWRKTVVKNGVSPLTLQKGAEAYAAHCRCDPEYPAHVKLIEGWLRKQGWTASYDTGRPNGAGQPPGRAAPARDRGEPKSIVEIAAEVAANRAKVNPDLR